MNTANDGEEKKKRGPALQNFLSQPFQLPVPSSQKLKVQESMKEIEELKTRDNIPLTPCILQ